MSNQEQHECCPIDKTNTRMEHHKEPHFLAQVQGMRLIQQPSNKQAHATSNRYRTGHSVPEAWRRNAHGRYRPLSVVVL